MCPGRSALCSGSVSRLLFSLLLVVAIAAVLVAAVSHPGDFWRLPDPTIVAAALAGAAFIVVVANFEWLGETATIRPPSPERPVMLELPGASPYRSRLVPSRARPPWGFMARLRAFYPRRR
jgi:hypothetical protein